MFTLFVNIEHFRLENTSLHLFLLDTQTNLWTCLFLMDTNAYYFHKVTEKREILK